jgi:hypothetical protein
MAEEATANNKLRRRWTLDSALDGIEDFDQQNMQNFRCQPDQSRIVGIDSEMITIIWKEKRVIVEK